MWSKLELTDAETEAGKRKRRMKAMAREVKMEDRDICQKKMNCPK